MTLRERAVQRFHELDQECLEMKDRDLVYNAGWHNGEWTCCCCGRMIGKNLNGDKPFLLARRHAESCAWTGEATLELRVEKKRAEKS